MSKGVGARVFQLNEHIQLFVPCVFIGIVLTVIALLFKRIQYFILYLRFVLFVT